MFSKIFILLLITTSAGCYFPSSKEKKEKPREIEYTVVSRTPHCNKKYFKITIDSSNHFLNIRMNLKAMKDVPFPVVAKENDTLFFTAFNFDLYCNNKIIASNFNKNKNTEYQDNYLRIIKDSLQFVSDTLYLRTDNEVIYQIPFYAFHNLKQGKQTIELHIWQDTFHGSAHDTIIEKQKIRQCNYATKSLFDAKIKFDIQVPPIYKSTVIGYGLQLKNDSTFSPVGMDNTIWNSSYPDIYWTILYPSDRFYAQTDYEKSTDRYEGSDTFDLYHYYLKDSIGIEVYDHDGLSRDDGMGYWVGPMDYLRRQPRKRISFGNIKWFDINISKAEIIN